MQKYLTVSSWWSPISILPAKVLVLQSQIFRILDLEYQKLAVIILLFCQVDVKFLVKPS